jgi:hypothetical protein
MAVFALRLGVGDGLFRVVTLCERGQRRDFLDVDISTFEAANTLQAR